MLKALSQQPLAFNVCHGPVEIMLTTGFSNKYPFQPPIADA